MLHAQPQCVLDIYIHSSHRLGFKERLSSMRASAACECASLHLSSFVVVVVVVYLIKCALFQDQTKLFEEHL